MAAVLAVNGCAEVENLLQFCNISKERIRVEEQKEFTSPKEPTLTFSSGKTVTGVRTVGAYLSRISTRKLLGGSALERALVDQWMEYCQSHLESSLQDGTLIKGAFRYLDKSLSRTVYLVGCQLTLADIMLYYALHPLMLELSIQEKEQFINLSRWFNQVQYYPGVRQYLPEVSFLRNMLYS